MSWNKDDSLSSGITNKHKTPHHRRSPLSSPQRKFRGLLLSGNVFFVLLAVGMMFGLGNAMMSDDVTSTKTTLSSGTASTNQATNPQKISNPDAQPLETASKLPTTNAASVQSSAAKAQGDNSDCDAVAKRRADSSRASARSEEMDKHHDTVFKLQSTGALTRFFDSDSYKSRIRDENTRHDKALQAIDLVYSRTLQTANCIE